jgi:hypothetical protein
VRGQARPTHWESGCGAGELFTTALLLLPGPILITVTELDWSPVVIFEPLLPPVLVDTLLLLWMLPP